MRARTGARELLTIGVLVLAVGAGIAGGTLAHSQDGAPPAAPREVVLHSVTDDSDGAVADETAPAPAAEPVAEPAIPVEPNPAPAPVIQPLAGESASDAADRAEDSAKRSEGSAQRSEKAADRAEQAAPASTVAPVATPEPTPTPIPPPGANTRAGDRCSAASEGGRLRQGDSTYMLVCTDGTWRRVDDPAPTPNPGPAP